MDNIAMPMTRAYAVTATFLSDGERFAVEQFRIEVVDGLDPYSIAGARASTSIYADDRVPDLTITIEVTVIDPEDPEPRPPSTAVRPICPRCGGDEIVRDACAQWDEGAQAWSLSGTYDCETCTGCGAEGDEFARWIPAASKAPADRFFWAVFTLLDDVAFATDIRCQHFCLEAVDKMAPALAADEWRRRLPPL
jgi:predicted RNA-binding Zn-ribbon protein involved in translation (DUF1610 family)